MTPNGKCQVIFLASMMTLSCVSVRENNSNANRDHDIRYLIVQSFVTRSDSGDSPAPRRPYKKQIENVYKQAGVEIVWMPPLFFDSTEVRDGLIKPNEIVKQGRNRGYWGVGVPRLNLIFVNAINGQRGPRGLGMTPGPICFVALPKKAKDPDMEAFSIIHEMGHCLGLIHAVDDPRADNNVPSVMGDGAFAERIGESALQQPHVTTVRASRLLLKHNNPSAEQSTEGDGLSPH